MAEARAAKDAKTRAREAKKAETAEEREATKRERERLRMRASRAALAAGGSGTAAFDVDVEGRKLGFALEAGASTYTKAVQRRIREVSLRMQAEIPVVYGQLRPLPLLVRAN